MPEQPVKIKNSSEVFLVNSLLRRKKDKVLSWGGLIYMG